MKRWIVWSLLVLVVVSLVACGQQEGSNAQKTTESSNVDAIGTEYVDVWKASVKTSLVDDTAQYETYVIELSSDGTGSYRDKKGTWEYIEDESKIVLTLTQEKVGIVIEISETNGMTTLKYYQDIYYRESNFVSP